ncbi:SNF2-related protein [Nannocystis pusilla]|uniref:DEAD/DEAH box helicase family protein n=1 Tax=Nannocystis pusilla TaxID=889268 RepID=A0ABS7TME9_9BACT|nr:SNF2-related protein [Nannocystis pusilla]MBZ5709375.1 DEAD/DEAH box helicase family protein [Nannocystis pusilla]
MTPAVILDKLLPRWRAKLPPSYSPEFIDGFIQRNRDALEAVVARAMMLRRMKRGEPPKTAEEFAAYAKLAARERPKDAEPDAAVIKRIMKRMDKMLARDPGPDGQEGAVAFGVEFAEIRAEAILLRQIGWDAVPLLLRRPALVILESGSPFIVRNASGELHLNPIYSEGSDERLRADLKAVQERVAQLRDGIADAARLDRYAAALWTRARAAGARPKSAPFEIETPPDLRDKSWRTDANLRAMRLALSKEPGELTAEDLRALAQYSGWGGLSIENVKKLVPPGLTPESFGLIHEYYTPTAIAEAIAETLCPLLPELAGNDGVVRALEPSAGIGRLIRAFSPRRCLELEAGGQIKKIAWTAVEFSTVSSTLLRALRPDADVYHGPFERWVVSEGPRYRGTIGLVVSNPPYGERGAMAREDPDEFYKEKRAFAYFMRRVLDLLVPGGVGVFLIPAGFLSGNLNRGLREKLLRRHHLLGAFRLPSHDKKGRETVPGAAVVMDVVFWRSRGGELTEVDQADDFILDGDYFKHHPDHILGREDGAFAGDDEAGMARSWRYTVTGDFAGLPALTPRPICTACVLTSIVQREVGPVQKVTREDEAIPADVEDDLRPALELGRRVGRYLAAVGADEAERAAQLWPELHAALRDFAATAGNPWRDKALRGLADRRQLAAAQHLLNAFEKSGSIAPALREPPAVQPKFSGQPNDVVAQAEALFRQQRALTLAQLMTFHKQQGGSLSSADAVAALLEAEWNLDGEAWDRLLPRDAYLTGNDLWARHDRATARAAQGDEQAKVQVRRLLEAIAPAVFDDLTDISPQHGYVPLDLVAGWISATLNGRYGAIELERKDGFVQLKGHDYTSEKAPAISPATLAFLGYYNHDPELFRPPQEKRDRDAGPRSREERKAAKQSLAERRLALAKQWEESFKAWVAADEGRREQLVHAYNRVARGRIVPTYTPEPLDIARWGSGAPKLKPHQLAGARRVLSQRGGLVAFDVGVGKTYTALAIIARARQEGWVRRPVILVPGSLVWKWHDDILCTLPDYRVVVIGSKRKRITRGVRKDVITSETDTPEQRAKKWTLLQTGQADVAILSYDALARTKMNEDAVMAYVEQVEAVARSIALRKRTLEEKAQNAKQKEKLSERERALLEHGVRAWVEEILALPSDWQYDPGVSWDDIGVDMLVIDEAAAFKNLYKPQAREDGVPKFMGGGGEGSDRAWQLDFRAAAVRRKTGGAGIVLLTATPAKNSPLEFYNLIQFIDPAAFTKAGIRDPEQFIDRFLKIEYREVLDSTLDPTKKLAVTGFKNLDDLRTILFTYAEFRTAAEVGLQLPRPLVETITIQMDEVQEAKYDRYVAEIEKILDNPNPEGSESYAILGLLARLSLIALHAALEDGYSYKTALEGGTAQKRVYQDGEPVDVTVRLGRPVYESPKLTECAKRVAASPHCGHIIFCEPTAVHQWMREVLVKHEIPRERIAILNAEETGPADRIRIAREFNGLSSEPPAPGTCARPTDSAIAPKYDVVIANSVAYEGIDLQVRTCTIHHLDLPWTPADLEQRNGRAVRQGNTLGTVQIYYYFADRSTDGYRFSLIDGKAGWLGELLKSQVRDTNNPAAQQQLTPEDIVLMISRNKEKTRALLEEKRKRQVEEARAKIAREAARLLRQAAARFRDARAATDPERAARLRDEGEQRLADLESVNADAWPWAPWMYAARDVDMIVPENGGAPVYEGLRVARPRAGAPDQFDYLEFGQIVSTEEGDKIGLRAAGSPGWQLVAYTGTLNGSPIAPGEMPRDGGPMWPDDDDTRTAAAIEKKIREVFRYMQFEDLRWRGASDAWLEKWWPRFEREIAGGLAESHHREKVPVVDEEGLAIAAGAEIRGATILPPTRAGWQRFLELAPASGESFTNLKDIGLAWWDRKVPQDLLSKERNLLRELIVPRLLEDQAYRNAREHSDAQNARIEHDKALGRVMLALFNEDPEKHGELYRRYADDEAFRRSLHEQSFTTTYDQKQEQRGEGRASGSSERPRLTDEQREQMQALLDRDARQDRSEPPEDVDRRVVDNLFLQRAAMSDALMMGGVGKADRQKQAMEGAKTAEVITVLRAEASILRGRGYVVSLAGNGARSFNVIGHGGQLLAARVVLPDGLFLAPEVDAETLTRLERDLVDAHKVVQAIMREERKGQTLDDTAMLAIWRRARSLTQETAEAGDAAMTLRIERAATSTIRAIDIRKRVGSLDEASHEYRAAVDASGEGASTFPSGEVILSDGQRYQVSYNGRVWSEGRVVFDPRTTNAPDEGERSEPPARTVERTHEEARSAIKVLGLPVKQHVKYLRQVDEAIASGKSYLPIIERARKAAEKLTAGKGAKTTGRDAAPAARPPRRILDAALDTLGAHPDLSRDLRRTDGYQEIARALEEFAVPSGISAEELQTWLESHHLMDAGDILARARVEPVPVARLMQELWDSVLDTFEVAEVDEVDGVLRVPENAIYDISGRDTILERVMEGDRASMRTIRVTRGDEAHGTVAIDDPTDRLTPGALVHLRGRDVAVLDHLYRKLRAFHHNLVVAPKTLQDVRMLLYWTAVMLDAPPCQGDVKARASSAFEQAKQYYDTARRRLLDGLSVDAVRRMQEALRRISAAAAEIARSCGEGQIDIAVTPPHLPVTPEDKAAITGGQVEERP